MGLILSLTTMMLLATDYFNSNELNVEELGSIGLCCYMAFNALRLMLWKLKYRFVLSRIFTVSLFVLLFVAFYYLIILSWGAEFSGRDTPSILYAFFVVVILFIISGIVEYNTIEKD